MKQYVVVLECSAGNDSVGKMWLETYVCNPETQLREIMKWKGQKTGGGRLMITEASEIIR